MRRRDLHAAGAERLVHILVGDDRDFAVAQRQDQHLADEVGIALIGRINCNGGVAQHGFRAGGRNRQVTSSVFQWIADVPHGAILFLGHHFQIGDGCTQDRIPVDQPFAAINQTLFIQADKHLGHHFGSLGIHGEVFAIPVGGRTQTAHLAGDARAGFFFPFPHFFQKFLAPQVVTGHFLRIQLALDHNLRCNTGMIGAGNPGRIEAAHAVIARQAIHDGLVERMPHVQGAGDIRWRQLDGERGFVILHFGGEIPALLPLRAPEFLDFGGFVRLG